MRPPEENYLVDIHCHPSMKPFGLACPGNTNNYDASLKNSIWHNDPPSYIDRMFHTLTITKFSQSNFTSLYQGNFGVVVVALYPVEKGFFTFKRFSDWFEDWLSNFISELGRRKIDFIQNKKDEYRELKCEYEFYQQLQDKELTIYGEKVRYSLTSDYSEIIYNLSCKNVISVVLSIEGISALFNDNSKSPDRLEILSNISEIKKWKHPPLFVTISHHFNNYISGHAKSLPKILNFILDQKPGMNEGLSKLGEEVIKSLLSNANGRRIYIDIKHMSRKVRQAYYAILENEFKHEEPPIPVFVSHGAVNGNASLDDPNAPQRERKIKFNKRDINFFDDEIIRIQQKGGIFGLQIDRRQITNSKGRARIFFFGITRKRKLKWWTGLIWNQIRYIADLLDDNNLPAWDIVCLGTDFDGMVNPIKGYRTSAELPELRKNLFDHAKLYLANKNFKLSMNKKNPDEVLDQIFRNNAMTFFRKYF